MRHRPGGASSVRAGAAAGISPALQCGVADDEAARREEALREAQKMEAIGRLAGGVAHDFNNVLTAIFGYVDLVLDTIGPESPARPDVIEIKRAAERAAALTRQLLAFSRRQVLQPRQLSPNAVVEGIASLITRLVTSDIDVALDLDPTTGDVCADRGQIEQVLMNLAANARDAMPQGGRLSVRTRNEEVGEECAGRLAEIVPGPYVCLTVEDTGTGMSDDVRRNIFEPFFTTKEQGRGTGLGLATAYGIVKQSGGWIYVSSDPGRGTRFTIYLPRVATSSV